MYIIFYNIHIEYALYIINIFVFKFIIYIYIINIYIRQNSCYPPNFVFPKEMPLTPRSLWKCKGWPEQGKWKKGRECQGM